MLEAEIITFTDLESAMIPLFETKKLFASFKLKNDSGKKSKFPLWKRSV